ncbi:MAG: PilT/PilU family type 4a pilus ATPase, partial [Planctomycetota bacterium]
MGIPALFQEIFESAVQRGASDIHIAVEEAPYFRVQGKLVAWSSSINSKISIEQISSLIDALLSKSDRERLNHRGSFDGAFSIQPDHRFRFNAFHKQGRLAFAIRFLPDQIPELKDLGLEDRLYQIANLKDGLVLVAGPTGSGKSTTIAAFIDRINQTRNCHIITVEDPIEFIHRSQSALVSQRQIGSDVAHFSQALQDAVRQDPDVILVGELRDLDTIRTAVTAAETGHLVFATVHAGDSKTAVERLVGAFPAEEQNLAQRLVATVLRTVIVQHLLPRMSNPNLNDQNQSRKRVLASEVMHANS